MVGAVTEEQVLALERCLDALQSHVADPVVTRQLVGLGGARLQCRVFPGHGSPSLGGVGESEGPRVPTGARVAAVVLAMRSSLTVACLSRCAAWRRFPDPQSELCAGACEPRAW
jgi:hypothetical protein